MLSCLVLAFASYACSGGSNPAAPVEAQAGPRIASVAVVPGVATIGPAASLRFVAEVRDAQGRAVQAPVQWQATGGTIDLQGNYVAGAAPGEFQVRAFTAGELAGTARITIHPATGSEGSLAASVYVVVGEAGAPNAAEMALRSRLESLVGTAAFLDDDQVTSASVAGCRLVVVSKTVASTKVSAKLKPASCGVLFWEDNLQMLDMMATIHNDGSSGTSWESTGRTLYVRSDAPAELRGGLAGSVAFYTASGTITHSPSGEPLPSSALVVAEMSQGSSRKAIYAYDSGQSLADGTPAAGRRVYFGLYDDSFDDLTADGLQLFDAAARWAAGSSQTTTPPSPPPTTPPQTTPPPAPSGIAIRPGESIQYYVDRHPEGTTFVLKAGVHQAQRIQPRSGQTFVGEPGAILDGQGADHAFRGTASNVTIKNLVIEHYSPGAQMGAIKAGGHSREESTEGWTVEACEVRYNEGGGIRTGNRMRVVNNNIHHNSQIGIVGMGDGLLVEGNEIAYNNWEKKYSYGWEAGGTKFVKTNGLVVRNNWSHNNWGPGLWTDIDNINVTYDGNLVEDNADSGIFHEISYKAVIRNNTLRRNGNDRVDDWAYGAGILVAHSPDVEVVGNILENNMNGIMGIQQDRGTGGYGPLRLDNLYVHDNRVTQQSGNWAAGAAQDVGDGGFFSRNLRFERNTYVLAGDNRWFEWNNGAHRASTWKSYGMDTAGSFSF